MTTCYFSVSGGHCYEHTMLLPRQVLTSQASAYHCFSASTPFCFDPLHRKDPKPSTLNFTRRLEHATRCGVEELPENLKAEEAAAIFRLVLHGRLESRSATLSKEKRQRTPKPQVSHFPERWHRRSPPCRKPFFVAPVHLRMLGGQMAP